MNCVDLCTGIGGFARALVGICKPLVYCDIDPRVQATIRDLISRRLIPAAPIANDVRDIDEIRRHVKGRRVDLLVSSSPCTGFSSAGLAKGLENVDSALFEAVMDMIETLKPRLVFFENVMHILATNGGKDIQIIVDRMTGMGYDMRWTIVAASDMGAPHVRKRWFCLCIHRDATRTHPLPDLPRIKSVKCHWNPKSRPDIVAPITESTPHIAMLGNAIVPQAAKEAFYRTYTGFHGGERFRADCKDPLEPRSVTRSRPYTKHAVVDHKTRSMLEIRGYPMRSPDEHIVMNPSHYRTQREYSANLAHPKPSPPVVGRIVRKSWPTPRTAGTSHSTVLSQRTRHDLPTVAIFCESLNGVAMPATDDGGRMNLGFACWLMGFPPSYLRPACLSKLKSSSTKPSSPSTKLSTKPVSKTHTATSIRRGG